MCLYEQVKRPTPFSLCRTVCSRVYRHAHLYPLASSAVNQSENQVHFTFYTYLCFATLHRLTFCWSKVNLSICSKCYVLQSLKTYQLAISIKIDSFIPMPSNLILSKTACLVVKVRQLTGFVKISGSSRSPLQPSWVEVTPLVLGFVASTAAPRSPFRCRRCPLFWRRWLWASSPSKKPRHGCTFKSWVVGGSGLCSPFNQASTVVYLHACSTTGFDASAKRGRWAQVMGIRSFEGIRAAQSADHGEFV